MPGVTAYGIASCCTEHMICRSAHPSFLARSERYGAFDSDPSIGRRTAFFRAAQIVTAALAFAPVSAFIDELSAQLESLNHEHAQQLRVGAFHTTRSVLENTANFVRIEQRYVQDALDRLYAHSSHAAATEIATMNRNLQRAALWPSRFLSTAHRALYRSIHASRAELGRWPDFGRQPDRETLGLQVAIAGRAMLSDARAPTIPRAGPARPVS
jgi:hypothetical protein